MRELQRLTCRRLITAATIVILGIFVGGNAYAYYEGNPYAPQTQVVCTNTPYYHCKIYDPSAAQNPYAYQNPYGYTPYPPGYGAGYIAGGGYNVDYYYPNWSDRDDRLIDRGAMINRGGGRR